MPNINKKIKSIFISDIHLSARSSKTKELLALFRILETNQPEQIFIVGDFIDFWILKSRFYWNEDCNTVLQKLLRFSRKGTEIIYLPGNHDEIMKDFDGYSFNNIKIRNSYEYVIDDKKYLIEHGDEYDFFVKNHKIVSHIGGWLYDILLIANHYLYEIRRKMGFKNIWSLSKYIKNRTKRATKVIEYFETNLVEIAKTKEYSGIICGHIHQPEIKNIDSIQYINTGDWVENCSFIVHYEGENSLYLCMYK